MATDTETTERASGADEQPEPGEIYTQGVEEGARRLERSVLGSMATGLIGGAEVMIGVGLMAVVSGALSGLLPAQTASVIGATVFGVGFVFIAVGRSELFTENFLVPVSTAFERRGSYGLLVRMWFFTMVANVVGLLAVAAIFSVREVLDHSAIEAAGHTTDVFARRSAGAAFLSAIVAGAIMTLWTWLNSAAQRDSTRVMLAMITGFALAAPTLNHVIVGTGEMAFGVLGGETVADWGDVARNFGIALAGNFVGGALFVTGSRMLQVRGDS